MELTGPRSDWRLIIVQREDEASAEGNGRMLKFFDALLPHSGNVS